MPKGSFDGLGAKAGTIPLLYFPDRLFKISRKNSWDTTQVKIRVFIERKGRVFNGARLSHLHQGRAGQSCSDSSLLISWGWHNTCGQMYEDRIWALCCLLVYLLHALAACSRAAKEDGSSFISHVPFSEECFCIISVSTYRL